MSLGPGQRLSWEEAKSLGAREAFATEYDLPPHVCMTAQFYLFRGDGGDGGDGGLLAIGHLIIKVSE